MGDDLYLEGRRQSTDLHQFTDATRPVRVVLQGIHSPLNQQLFGLPARTCSPVAIGVREDARNWANSPTRSGGIGSSIHIGVSGSSACSILVA